MKLLIELFTAYSWGRFLLDRQAGIPWIFEQETKAILCFTVVLGIFCALLGTQKEIQLKKHL